MHVNYEFLLDRAESLCPPEGKCLDYGCGKGQIVEEGVRRGIDFYGVEAFAAGSGTQIEKVLRERGLLDERVKALDLENFQIPYPDDFFDVVVSNQVFEHVVNLEKTLSELFRVLKTGGTLISIFPTYEVVREVHCGILFAHWMPRSRLRYAWLLSARTLGGGRLKRGRTRRKWAEFFNEWLVDNVNYRWPRELHRSFRRYFGSVVHLEDDYMNYYLSKRVGPLSQALDNHVFRLLTRRVYRSWGGFVVSLKKAKR